MCSAPFIRQVNMAQAPNLVTRLAFLAFIVFLLGLYGCGEKQRAMANYEERWKAATAYCERLVRVNTLNDSEAFKNGCLSGYMHNCAPLSCAGAK
jgi:hypothetical protein